MKKITTVLLVLFCLGRVSPQNVTIRMDEVMNSYSQRGFMGSVLVARNGRALFEKSYGLANLELNAPNTNSTRFRIGSLTKQFTAACILLLEERGKLKTEDPVKKYLPSVPSAWAKITIYNLLTHTSGIPDYVSFDDSDAAKTRRWTPEQLVLIFRDRPLEFQPGEKEEYSSSNYTLLGYLIEEISKQKYSEFLQANIFTPLVMKDSGYDLHTPIINNRASGYSLRRPVDWEQPAGDNPEPTFNADCVDMTWAYAAGAIYSTVEDLLRWEEGLFGGKLLSPASLKKMTTPFLNEYACGVGVHDVGGHRVINHNGGIDGFSAHLAYFPEDKTVVVVLSNLRAKSVGPIALQLAAASRG